MPCVVCGGITGRTRCEEFPHIAGGRVWLEFCSDCTFFLDHPYRASLDGFERWKRWYDKALADKGVVA